MRTPSEAAAYHEGFAAGARMMKGKAKIFFFTEAAGISMSDFDPPWLANAWREMEATINTVTLANQEVRKQITLANPEAQTEPNRSMP